MLNYLNESEDSYLTQLGWCPSGETKLLNAEAVLLKGVNSVDQGEYVEIGPVISPKGDRIFTYRTNLSSTKTPVVLVHGFAAGSALWCTNIDALSKHRPLYTFDIIGFGRSSRPQFSDDPAEIEEEFVRSIEAWRKVLGLEKFYMLGHSFGAYISTLYAMKHPHRVAHLLVAEPWGYTDRKASKIPMWALPIEFGAAVINPLWILRVAGPFGYIYLQAIPPFLTNNFPNKFKKPAQATASYFYHLNVKKPMGESAFHKLMLGIGWAKRPIIKRIRALRKEVPMTFIYGEKSWVFKSPGIKIKHIRNESFVDIHYMPDAGHMVYTDQPETFNKIVVDVLHKCDTGVIPNNPLTDSVTIASDFNGTNYWSEGESTNQELDEDGVDPAVYSEFADENLLKELNARRSQESKITPCVIL